MANSARYAVGGLAISAAAFVAMLSQEGYTDTAVVPTRGDVPTIGFGTTAGVKMGDRIAPVKAVQRALADTAKYEGAIKKCIKVPLSQAEYDVYTNLAYNVGPTNFCFARDKRGKIIGPSSLSMKVNAGDYAGGCAAILDYKYAAGYDCSTPGNKRCYGVWTRRLESNKKCMEAQ